MKKRIIIPARYASTRLPAKLLIEVAGKPILQHTYERALECNFDSILIATDHLEIAKLCDKIGADYVMTRKDHPSGTDRCSEAMEIKAYAEDDLILGLQGDEPLVPVNNLLRVADNLIRHPEVAVATLCEPMTEQQDIFNPNQVKVIFNQHHHALYCSRAPSPWARDNFPETVPEEPCYFRHIGIYVYRGNFLKHYPTLIRPDIERLESLEQLRILFHGYKIHVDLAPEKNPPGVDTAASLDEVRQILG